MRRIAAFLFCLASTACFRSGGLEAGADASVLDVVPDVVPDVTPDTPLVEVNCSDPSIWAPAEELPGTGDMGGGPCEPPQYPLHVVTLSARLDDETRMEVASSCWRVEEAHPDSGWEEGQTFGGGQSAYALIQGFERPVTFRGRLLRRDGSVAYAVAPVSVALEAAHIVPVREPIVALFSDEAWASQFALHIRDDVVEVDEVLAGGGEAVLRTLHRGLEGYWVREGRLESPAMSARLNLGDVERVLFDPGGGALTLDDTLVRLGDELSQRRTPLPGPPLSVVRRYHYTVVQLSDRLVVQGEEEEEAQEIALTPSANAHLVEGIGDSLMYYAGGTYTLVNVLPGSISLTREYDGAPFAETGRPLFVHEQIVITERGFQFIDAWSDAAGPRFASTESLFGGGRIVSVAADHLAHTSREASYVVEFDDGTQQRFDAPFISFCD